MNLTNEEILMVDSFTSITATFDYKTIRTIIKLTLLCVIFVVLGIEIYQTLILQHKHDNILWYLVFVIPAGIYNFVQIMGYNRYDIIRLTHSNNSKLDIITKIICTFKTVMYHGIELIFVPLFVGVMIFLAIIPVLNIMSALTILFVVIYLIQILPLKIKQNQYLKMAYAAILEARDEIKTTRILITMDTLDKDERKTALEQHIMAEEMISINSSFFFVSSSFLNTIIGGIRYLLPIVGTTIGFIFDMGLLQ